MRYLSVCSGIEAATVAWHPLGWEAAAFSEIELFPSAVLHKHYGSGRPHFMPDPDEPGLDSRTRKERAAAIKAVRNLPLVDSGLMNLGDMARFKEWPDLAIDLLVGGTPCQSFSVAGLRAGLDDPRGNLLLTYLAIAARYRPRWMVWENVPGVLSIDEGRAFGALLGGMAELGYGWSYRVVDAQFTRSTRLPFAVPQRRRRVFVVGYLGDWRRAAAVLFDAASLRGDPPPRREAGKGIAPTLSARTKGGGGLGTDFDLDGGLVEATVAHSLRAEGFDASEDGTGRGTPLVPAIPPAMKARDAKGPSSDGADDGLPLLPVVAPTLRAGGNKTGGDRPPGTDVDTVDTLVPIAFHGSQDPDVSGNVTHAIQAGALRQNPSSGPDGLGVQEGIGYTMEARAEVQAVAYDMRGREGGAQFEQRWAVRRITPREGERLQGYDDDYTAIMVKGKPAADGPRYKALGNSMATNVMEAIGERIDMVDKLPM